MNSDFTDTDHLTASNEAAVVEGITRQATQPTEVYPGILGAVSKSGTLHLTSLEQYELNPRRKKATETVVDVDSFTGYLAKHGLPETEIWANESKGLITAIINAHGGLDPENDEEEGRPGWRDHSVTLQLRHTPDWNDWTAKDGDLLPQILFAEFIEDHLPNFVDPTGADMLELAQTFQAKTKVDFESSQRLQSGETQLTFVENTTAAAGKKGTLAIPDTFTIGVQPFDRGKAYRVPVRLRYRITGGQLHLGYKLTRPEDVLRAAFDEVVTKASEDTGRNVWSS